MLSKRHRQELIKSLVRRSRVETQSDLAEALTSMGCEVTQATVSRDVRELGLTKVRDPLGRPHYALADNEERRDPEGACARMLSEFGRSVTPAQNLVLVKGEVGTAPGLGKVIDELDHELIVGTVAGDDTVLVVCESAETARTVGAYLERLGG